MAIKFQYNKTSLQQLEKQLKMRERSLPTIKRFIVTFPNGIFPLNYAAVFPIYRSSATQVILEANVN